MSKNWTKEFTPTRRNFLLRVSRVRNSKSRIPPLKDLDSEYLI